MWRRRSPPARTTSSSVGRSARRRIHLPRRPRSSRRSLGFSQRLQQAPEVLVVGEERTVEELGSVALDQDGGEVVHLPVAHFLGVVLEVEPAEARLRKLLRQLEE